MAKPFYSTPCDFHSGEGQQVQRHLPKVHWFRAAEECQDQRINGWPTQELSWGWTCAKVSLQQWCVCFLVQFYPIKVQLQILSICLLPVSFYYLPSSSQSLPAPQRPRSIEALNQDLATLDTEYNSLSEHMAKGEQDDFNPEWFGNLINLDLCPMIWYGLRAPFCIEISDPTTYPCPLRWAKSAEAKMKASTFTWLSSTPNLLVQHILVEAYMLWLLWIYKPIFPHPLQVHQDCPAWSQDSVTGLHRLMAEHPRKKHHRSWDPSVVRFIFKEWVLHLTEKLFHT